MKICFLGTGASVSGGQRLNTSLLVKLEDENLLIDCSGFPEQALARHQITPKQISDLILTHSHVDHLYGLPSFLHAIRLLSLPDSGGSIRIHGLPETLDTARQLVDAFGLMEKSNPTAIQWFPLEQTESSVKLEIEGITVNTFPVCHGDKPCLGLELIQDSRHLVYSADSEVCSTLVDRLTVETTLIHDCGAGLGFEKMHAGAPSLARMLAKHPCQTVILCHLPFLEPGEKEVIAEIIQSTFTGQLLIPDDGDEVEI
jgi:ribonuclease Z